MSQFRRNELNDKIHFNHLAVLLVLFVRLETLSHLHKWCSDKRNDIFICLFIYCSCNSAVSSLDYEEKHE
jgi:hypothetical protein